MSEPSLPIKHYLPYLALIVILGLGIWLILTTGSRLYSQRTASVSLEQSAHANPHNSSTESSLTRTIAFSGLRMQISLLNDWQSWAICVVIIAVAIVGKLGASMLMARWTGMNLRDSFSLGALMNTRGLVELIVLNIGYDLGIVSARAFVMLVLMALVTTFMTGPLLSLARMGSRD